jgi:hypothetical protein
MIEYWMICLICVWGNKMNYGMIRIVILTLVFGTAVADQEAGVGLEATVGTGYGLYAVTMRASGAPGAISSFYLYDQNGSYPSRWHEIDLEFSPGFTGAGRIVDANHPHFKAEGACFDVNTADTLPTKENCIISPFLTGEAGSGLSFNTYNYRSIDGEPYAHSNTQVFMKSNHDREIFSQYYTYYFYYTPKGIYWTKDLPAQQLTMSPPATLPEPSFVKLDTSIVENSAIWQGNLAFLYDSKPLNPVTGDGELTQHGALMKMSMNIWDGSNTDASHVQDWGGPRSPAPGSSSSYKYVAYYPLETNVNEVGADPTKLKYGSAVIYSDFTTPGGKFYLNQKETTFTTLWHVSNGIYLWPLGQLDERNLVCGHGELTLKISRPYATPRKNYERIDGCDWLNKN